MQPGGRSSGRGAWAAIVGLAVGAALLAGVDEPEHAAATQPPTRPNVLLIETDDQALESLRVMTNVQRTLVASGTTFENSVVGLSLCCPSRATILTGQYAHNHGVLDNRMPNGGYDKLDGTSTLPVWLQRAGYYTAHIGKYLNGYGARKPTEIPPGWSEWHGAVDPSTYRFYGYTLNEGGRTRRYGGDAASYQTDVYAAKALDLIRRRAPQAQPFFLWLAFLAPHSGNPREAGDPALATPVPAPRHRDRLAAEPLPTPPSLNEADVSDKPAALRARPRLTAAQLAQVREAYQQRLESLLAVDEAVGQLFAELERLGELDRTLIVFTSDNGFLHGEHRVPSGKLLVYEPSIRVPLIVRGLDVPQGRRLRQPVSNVDVAATILDVAGATPGRRLDGRSLLPLLRDPNVSWGRDLLVERGPGAGSFAALLTPRYKYVEYVNGERELYDLAGDPDELESRHADPAYAELRTELAGRLASLRTCAGDTCRRGPLLRLRVRGASPCVRTRAVTSLGGADGRLVARVDVSVGGIRRVIDVNAPYEAELRARLFLPAGFPTLVRARAYLSDGRVATYDRRVRRCAAR